MNFFNKKTGDSKNRKDSGFSLIELIVVVILLGILAAIAIPAYNGIENRAKASVVEAAASNALKEAIVADSLGSDSSKFQEILDNNSNDDVTVVYHDSSGQRSNVPGNPIVVESWWTDGSSERFNVVVPAPTTPGDSGGVTPPNEEVDNSIFRMTLLCDNDATYAVSMYPIDEITITNKSDDSQSVYSDYASNDYSDKEFALSGGIEYTFTASATGDNFDYMYLSRNAPGRDCIRSIDSWGSQAPNSLSYSLANTQNLEHVASIPANVTNISQMFTYSSFNGDLSHWDTSNVTDMWGLFDGSDFNNSSINNWNTGNVTNMQSMFRGSIYDGIDFNQDISNWDTSNVTNMSWMFAETTFNYPIGGWDVSQVTNMEGMFENAIEFNQDLSNWDTSNVTNMSYMFSSSWYYEPKFNTSINSWDVSSVTDMSSMFYYSSYNQPLNNWNTGNVKKMNYMFSDSNFDQNISNWDVSNVEEWQNIGFAIRSPMQGKDEFLPNFPDFN